MKITNNSLQKQVYDLIKRAILKRSYLPGEIIPTKQISDELGISTMPVRSALQELTDYGIVVKRERVGFFVKEFTASEINDVMDVRMMYELHGLQGHFDSLDFKRFRQIYDMLNTEDSLSREEYRQIDFELHFLFVEATNNRLLVKQYKQIQDIIQLIMSIDWENDDIITYSTKQMREEHNALLEAILSRNNAVAVDAFHAHMEAVHNTALNIINSSLNKKVSVR